MDDGQQMVRLLIDAIKSAQELSQSYQQANKGVPMPVPVLSATPPVESPPFAPASGIIGHLSEITNTKIWIQRLPGLKRVLAYIMLFGEFGQIEQARIRYTSDTSIANRCMSRFLVCKEASHVLLATPKNATTTKEKLDEAIASMLTGAVIPNDPAIITEYAAYYAAIEMMLPFQLQKEITEFLDYPEGLEQAAESTLTPLNIVKIRYQNNISPIFEQAYRELGLI